MTYRRLRPTKNISTEKLKKLSDKVCDKIKEAAYESMVNAINGDKDSKDKIVASSYYILHIQQEFRDYCAVIAGKYEKHLSVTWIISGMIPGRRQVFVLPCIRKKLSVAGSAGDEGREILCAIMRIIWTVC